MAFSLGTRLIDCKMVMRDTVEMERLQKEYEQENNVDKNNEMVNNINEAVNNAELIKGEEVNG